jgi:hypothetical protein
VAKVPKPLIGQQVSLTVCLLTVIGTHSTHSTHSTTTLNTLAANHFAHRTFTVDRKTHHLDKQMADKDYDSDDSAEVVEQKEEVPEVVEDVTLTNPDVVTKYQEAAKIAQAALLEIASRVSFRFLFCAVLITMSGGTSV